MDQSESNRREIAEWLLDRSRRRIEYTGLLPLDVWHIILCSFVSIHKVPSDSAYSSRFCGLQHSFGDYSSCCRIYYRCELRGFYMCSCGECFAIRPPTIVRAHGLIYRLGTPTCYRSNDTFPSLDECRAALRRNA